MLAAIKGDPGVQTVPKYRASMTLKAEIAALLESSDIGIRALIVDDKGVIRLLQAAIKREGSISAFSRRHSLELSQLNKMLNGRRSVSRTVLKALGLRKVYVTE